MVWVKGNVMNPVARKGETVEVADTEQVRRLVNRGVLEYVENHVSPVEVEADSGVDADDVTGIEDDDDEPEG